MNGTSSNFSEVRPDAEETQQFWRDIWGKEVLHNENAEWFKEFKKERVEARQEDIVITALCRMCGSKGETIAHVVSECGSWRRQIIKEGTITWHGISTGNFAVNVDWKELIAGMNRSQREWWKDTVRFHSQV